MYTYHSSVARTVLWFSDEYIRTKTWEYLKKAFGEALYVAPNGLLVAAKVGPNLTPRESQTNDIAQSQAQYPCQKRVPARMVPREYSVYERSGMDDTFTLERSEEDVSMAITSKGEEVPAEQWRRRQQDFGN